MSNGSRCPARILPVRQQRRQHLGAVQRWDGHQIKKPQTHGQGRRVQQKRKPHLAELTGDQRPEIHATGDQQQHQRQQEIGHGSGQRGDGHALLGLFEITGIHRHGLRPAEARHHHHDKTQPVDVPQGVQAQPVGTLGGGVAQRVGRQAMARLVNGQAQEHGAQPQQNAPQRAEIQRVPQIRQIMQSKLLPERNRVK